MMFISGRWQQPGDRRCFMGALVPGYAGISALLARQK